MIVGHQETEFRPATGRDAAEIFALFEQGVADLQKRGIDQWDELYPDKELLSEDIAGGQMYVLTHGGRIVSAVVLNEEQYEAYGGGDWADRDGRCAVIHRLCVHPGVQGRGIGRETLSLAEKHLAGEGYSSIRLDAFFENKAALRLYERMGYSLRGGADFRKGAFGLYEKALG